VTYAAAAMEAFGAARAATVDEVLAGCASRILSAPMRISSFSCFASQASSRLPITKSARLDKLHHSEFLFLPTLPEFPGLRDGYRLALDRPCISVKFNCG
jgi:hypothetical protein